MADDRERRRSVAGADTRERGAERVAVDLGERGGRLAPDAGGRLLVPGGADGASRSSRSSVGNRHGLRIESGAPIVGRDDFLPCNELVGLARERGGSLRLS